MERSFVEGGVSMGTVDVLYITIVLIIIIVITRDARKRHKKTGED